MADKKKLFRPITEVEVVESVNAEDTVLIEQDGVAKRAPKGSIGAQSDWNVNDETNPAYVKNRTHWTEKVVDIRWDGNLEGHVTVDAGEGALLVHVSDEVLTVADLVGSTATVYIGTEQIAESKVLTESDCMESPGGAISIDSDLPVGFISPADEHTEEGVPVTLPKKGVYLFYVPDEIATRSITKETVHQLDPKFIPDSVGGSAKPVIFTVSSGGDRYLMVGSNYATAEEVVDAYFNGVGYVKEDQTPEKIIGFCASGDPYNGSSSYKGVVALTHMGDNSPSIIKYGLSSWDGYSDAIDKWLS